MVSAIEDLMESLRKHLRGDVRTDLTTRLLYSTDASIYQIEPLGVVFPRDLDELQAIIEQAALYHVPILARGAGSSLGGQAIGSALIVDCSRRLNHILEINPEEKTALVEPGVVLNALNRAAARWELQFGPDPASAERATLGGSIANNAAGAHSITYGMAADHLLAADVILADGSLAHLGEMNEEMARQAAAPDRKGLEAGFYRAALNIREAYAAPIREHWPRTWRRASGYNLNYLLPWSPSAPPRWAQGNPGLTYPPATPGTINLAPLLAGSEGTLAVLQRIRLRLSPTPKHTLLCVTACQSIEEACDQVPELLEFGTAAVELIPRVLIRLARSVPAYAAQLAFVDEIPGGEGDPAAMLVVEFAGDDPGELDRQAGRLAKHTPILIARDRAEQSKVWAVRKVGLGLLQSRPGDVKSTAFIEDLAVPVERLGVFVREMEAIFTRHHTEADFYAHASAGCLHIRPLLNLKTAQGLRDLRSIAREAVQLTIHLGGSVSGEHGDGLARSEWLPQLFGEEVIEAFRLLKHTVDPQGLLNPGKIVPPEGQEDLPAMDQHLRYAQDHLLLEPATVLDFSRQGGILGAIEQCNGAGVCRKAEGVMCPSFQATQDEMHSTRGRANLMRAMINGRFPDGDQAEKTVYEALDLCLACKGCKTECPSGVDMAKLKYEFDAAYYNHHRRRVRDYLFGYLPQLGRLGQPFGRLANPLMKMGLLRRAGDRWFGLAARRSLPAFARKTFSAQVSGQLNHLENQKGEAVLFLSDAFTEFFQPEVGLAAVRVLQEAGCRVILLPEPGASRTLISKGFLEPARARARRLVKEIQKLDPAGEYPLVGVEPSEIAALRDEYLDLLPGDDAVKGLAGRSWMIDEFLMRPAEDGTLRIDKYLESGGRSQRENGGKEVYLHGHCYQKAAPPAPDGFPMGVQATQAMLRRAGFAVNLVDSGCCGMAGAFGYEAEHYELSMKVAELKLLPALRQASPQAIFAASGVSCQAQIEDGARRAALHPICLI